MDPKLADLYRHVGELLSRYKSGKLPKAFKIIPNLRNWQQVCSLAWQQPMHGDLACCTDRAVREHCIGSHDLLASTLGHCARH